MKKSILTKLFALLVLGGFILTSCDKDDDDDNNNQPPCEGVVCPEGFTATVVDNHCECIEDSPNYIVDKAGFITADETWDAEHIYKIIGKVVVSDGVTLTIEPGTIIKGAGGEGTLASALLVARGGKLHAAGTAERPIIMTSIDDNITVGQTEGTNLSQSDMGLWGGLIVLGKAPGSFDGGVTEFQIEGIPADDVFGLYGGNVADDNSGVLQYISIRHGGATIGQDNEINGLTLGCVGSGTTIDHIEVVANNDDGVEFFGGTVNASELLVWAQGDDGLDIDQAYAGTISNSMVVLGVDSDHALEIDGPEGTATGLFTLNNITLVGNAETSKGEYADYRDGARGASNNIFAYGFKDDSDVELDNNSVAQQYIDGNLTFSGWEIVLPNGVEITDIFKEKTADGEEKISTFEEDAPNFATGVTEGAQTVGADAAEFEWTFAKSKGAF